MEFPTMDSAPVLASGWYLAELVVEITVGSAASQVIQVHMVLVEARTSEEAYERSLALGREHNDQYLNPKGEGVTSRFAGLRNLAFVDGEIVHGTEIGYEETIVPRTVHSTLPIRAKGDLDVFDRTWRPAVDKPDYRYAEIERMARAMMATARVAEASAGEGDTDGDGRGRGDR